MKSILLFTVALLLYGTGFAQTPHNCATDSLWKSDTNYLQRSNAFAAELAQFRASPPASFSHQYLSSDSNTIQSITAGCKEVVYIIPVVVHIDESGGTVNVTDSQVRQQIAILNDHFVLYGIRFVLAKKRPDNTSFSGINRFSGSFNYRFNMLAASYASSTTHYYNPEKYLNIYVTPSILASDGSPSPIAGFNQRFADWPTGPDLVVVKYTKFGDYNTCTGCGTLTSNSKGLVAVHEAGHYLGLRELWQGGCGEGNDAATCGSKGDLCCDTRPINVNYSCPVPGGNDCSYHLSIPDNHENYMDYTGEDCQNNFTTDQVGLMTATLQLYRNKLVSPQNLNTLDLSDCFASAWFDAEENFMCDSGEFKLHAIAYTGALTYRWVIKKDTVTIMDTTRTTNTFTWKSKVIGNYEVMLEITYDTTYKSRVTRPNYLQVADCGNTIASDQGNWYFGEWAGLKFTAGGAIRDNEPWKRNPFNINTGEGTISQSNSNGRLQFYGGGTIANLGYMEIYNRNYVQMSHSPIFGDFSSCQAGSVVQMPGDTNKYYVFTVAGPEAFGNRGFRYSIIDMTLDGGLGDVVTTSKNVPIKGPVGTEPSPLDSSMIVSEQIAVIPKCNNQEYWILVLNGFYSDSSTGLFIQVFELDNTGVNYHGKYNTPITIDPNKRTVITQLKASPNGNWLFVFGKLLRFDKASGTISPYKNLINENFGASFSPDSKLLYASKKKTGYSCNLYQFDLQSSNDSLSKTLITEYPIENLTMQLGPDERLYISKDNQTSLALIQKPDSNINNLAPNACMYTYSGPTLKSGGIGGKSYLGLPNMRDAKFPSQIPLDFVMIDSACGNVSFIPSNACASSYKWNFGDGDSSVLREPKHTYTDTGLYTVTLTINGTTAKQKTIFIGIPSKISGDSIACVLNGNMVNYSISNRDDECTYTWGAVNGTPTVDPNNNLSVLWGTGTGKVILNMVNPNNGCVSTDTLTIVPNFLDSNRIWADTALCFSGKPLKLFGTVTTSTMGVIKYLWEFSKNGQMWGKITNGDTLQNLTGTIQDTILWYRRVAKHGNCQFISNQIRISPVYIVKDLFNKPSCSGVSGGTSQFQIILRYEAVDTVTLQFFHYKEISSGNWQWTTSSTFNYPHTFSDTVKNGDSVKIKITRNGCGFIFSKTVSLKAATPRFVGTHTEIYCTNFWVMNDLDSVSMGIDTFFYAQVDSALSWLKESQDGDLFFRWQKYNPTTGDWEVVPNSNNDTLFLNINYGTQGRYRVQLLLTHPQTLNCKWYSCFQDGGKTITLKTDLWSKDGVNDIGIEPNTATANDYWGSPDLWNCWPDSTCTTHKSPEYVNVVWNYLRTTVRNKGTVASGAFEVKTYWTLGGFYEQWPKSWHLNLTTNGFYNSTTNTTYPMGQEIGTKSFTSIPANSTQGFTFQWDPPYPGWYNTSPYFGTSKISHPICILSRIESHPDTAFGMTYPEIVPTGHNVINNNNIVTRNTEVYDSIGFNKTTPEWVLRMGNQWADQRKIKVVIDNTVSNFWDLGYYVVQLEPHIHTAWEEGGSVGDGFTLVGNTFYIYSDSFYLDNITLDEGVWGWVHFQFRLDSATTIIEDRGSQMFSFVQYSAPIGTEVYEPDGGFNFLLNLYADTSNSESHVDSLDFIIIPNPTEYTETVEIEIDMNFATTTAVLNIYDQWGGTVITEMELGDLNVGENIREVYIAELSAGSYSVVITANGQNYSQTMVILD